MYFMRETDPACMAKAMYSTRGIHFCFRVPVISDRV
ncbi:hypothetical protein GXY_09309 [Novacetimonas hansenii ATCC 23769]|uniref:Uncharacterized protein n=1 Tax=Novacetimonas hansenii ATCC 23769 TaxID=714995 RepID=D5QFE2_NOVHA|nr:hypothetical protein GXY_09309 [Novacetimonas hansenii ATCC 23769]